MARAERGQYSRDERAKLVGSMNRSPPGEQSARNSSLASRLLLVAGTLYIVDVVLPWRQRCIAGECVSISGWEGIGVLNLLLAITLVVWEALWLAGAEINAPRALVSAGLAAAIVLFTILKIVVDWNGVYLFAWIGLLLALVIGYGGWMRWQEHQAVTDGLKGGDGDTV
jgi:hypothetical protein